MAQATSHHLLTGTPATLLRVCATIFRRLLRSNLFGRLAWRCAPAIRRRFSPAIQIETRYCGNVRFIADLKNHIETQIFWQGVQQGDRGKLSLMLQILEPDNVMFDVGANVGAFTLAAASRLPKGEVHAFEPWSVHLERLAENLRLNGFTNVHVNPFALGEETCTATLHIVDPVNTGMATLFPGKKVSKLSSDTWMEVSCQLLDDYVREKDVTRIDMIKIDVEGAELSVLRGAENTLAQFHPKLLMEMNPSHLARAGETPDSLFELLRKHGYTISRIEHDAHLTRLNGPEDLMQHQNIYCDAG